jgi:NADPH:quinone reductase-like Zn-dependent oxidoreductase
MEHRSPLVLGKDFAGEVDAIGAGVTDYAVGDRVFGTVTKPYLGDGSFAEYVTVPTAVGLAPLPETVSFTDAAALGLAGAAAHGIIDGAALDPATRSWSSARQVASATRWSSWRRPPAPG